MYILRKKAYPTTNPIGDCQGLYIERPGDNSLIWGDASVGGGFALASDNLDKTAIKKIAEKISTK